MGELYQRDYLCKVQGVFPNEEPEDVPNDDLVERIACDFPELPHWMISAAVLFHNKNPHYATTGVLGKDKPSQEQINMMQEEKLRKFEVHDEWWGVKPEDHKPITQEEALAMKNASKPEPVIKSVEVEKIEEIVSKV